ncbi:MAG: hypothetical protein E6J90_01480 [Deltaproteobacteria bacterium]|nr:MAG: hypothetical protein E6J90_01480 [Deltaproteobacteria bacterium]
MPPEIDVRTLFAQPRLSVVSGEPDLDLQHIAQVIGQGVAIDGRDGLALLLDRMLDEVDRSSVVAAKTLDLIGHTRTAAALLALGDWLIDGDDPATVAVFCSLAEREVLPRLGVHTLRLLGCDSASTPEAQATLCRLSELLGLEVCGASQLLHAGHYETGGFGDHWRFLLVSASELRHRASHVIARPGSPHPRILDLAALPAVELSAHAGAYPRCVVTEQAAQRILQLVHRSAGAPLPGFSALPSIELALPSRRSGAYHIAHLILNGTFLRFYPDGMARMGIVYPVTSADALRDIIASLR